MQQVYLMNRYFQVLFNGIQQAMTTITAVFDRDILSFSLQYVHRKRPVNT